MSKNKKFAKTLTLILLSAVMAMAGAFGAFAETIGNSTGWERTSDGGWRYIKSDGHMAGDEWVWIGEESTGYRCYFFDSSGTLVTNAFLPTGEYVNTDGAWVDNGVEQVRMFFDTTRAPFGNEVTNGDAIPAITLSSHMTSLIDMKSSAAGFPNRKYIQTMSNGDVLFYTTNNDTQIKIQTNGDSVAAIETPARLMFNNFPDNGIEVNALYENMRYSIVSASGIQVSPEDLAVYFEEEPYSFEAATMIVMSDRSYEVAICLTQGTDGRYYVYPSSPVLIRLHIDFDDSKILGPGVQ